MSDLEVLVENASEDELRTIVKVLQRAREKPALLVTVNGRRYVVDQEDEAAVRSLVGLSADELKDRVYGAAGRVAFGARWMRGYGRVDEMCRTLSLWEVTKVAEADRARVWGR
jgi:hypothetical protein